ncbi:hypothetical protein CSC3H3_14155 [Thalassospira marina]|uniref:Uncharacterized protein n=1 Tax=Thalassospira marina TaxID=2048283 RepID=A0ABM6QAY5_9PROT|nr:hypothetical protein CSC3H3_14155 [Thalassospira marina]
MAFQGLLHFIPSWSLPRLSFPGSGYHGLPACTGSHHKTANILKWRPVQPFEQIDKKCPNQPQLYLN